MRYEHFLRIDQIGNTSDNPEELAIELEEYAAKIRTWLECAPDLEMEITPTTDNKVSTFIFHTEDPIIMTECDDFEPIDSLFNEYESETDDCLHEFEPDWGTL